MNEQTDQTSRNSLARRVLDFWFGAPDSVEHGMKRLVWFQTDANFDSSIREQFSDDLAAAGRGAHDDLVTSPEGALALVIMLDQFPRNLYRGDARSFAYDAKARGIADAAIARGFDKALTEIQRQFLYLPFEHSENLADQERSVALFTTLDSGDDTLQWAERHREVIRRFGRFPHRNAVLGRATTADEQAFLDANPKGF